MEDNKLDLFIKIIRLTESDNDNQSLVAIRKANAMLKANGWDWERLLRGKVKVIADPFANAPAFQQEAKPAQFKQQRPQKPAYNPPPPPPPPPQYAKPATNPFAGMSSPPKQPRPSTAAPPTPKAGPLHFRKSTNGDWCIASYMKADIMIGQVVTIHKKDGSTSNETCGAFVEICPYSGHFLYKIAKASKFKSKFAEQTGVEDLL